MRSLFGLGPTDFVEIGPGSTLLRMGQQCASNGHARGVGWIPSIHPDGSDRETFAAALAFVSRRGSDAARPVAEAPLSVDPKIVALVRRCVARITKQPEANIHRRRALSEYGMDSLMAVEFAGAVLSELHLPDLARRWDNRWLKRRLHAIIDEGLRTHVAVVRGHKVASYPGHITYIRPRRSWIRGLNLTVTGTSWAKVAQGGIEVRWMPGTHYGMFRGGHGAALAASLNECLRRGDRS